MKIIDLTLTISNKIPTFPGSPQPIFIQWENIKDDGYNLELLFLSSHTGTHLDAPYHFLEKGKKIHEISLKRLIINAILVKIRKRGDKQITKTDIQKFEKKHGKIRDWIHDLASYIGNLRLTNKKYKLGLLFKSKSQDGKNAKIIAPLNKCRDTFSKKYGVEITSAINEWRTQNTPHYINKGH